MTTAPIVVALIDIGSTCAYLHINEIRANGTTVQLDALAHPVAVGGDTFIRGRIAAKTIRALCGVLKNFAQLAREYQAREIRAVATSAFREAENKDLVVERIRHETGINIQVLDNIEESRVMCQLLLPFVRNNLSNARKHILFMELGGGSTVTLLLRKDKIVRANYRRLGAARLARQAGREAQSYQFCENIIHNALDSTLLNYRHYAIGECVFVNPQLLKILPQLPDVKTINGGFNVSVAAIKELVKKIKNYAHTDKIAEALSLNEDEAQRLIPAVINVAYLCDRLKLSRFNVIDAEMLEALLHEIKLTLQGKNPLFEFSEQVLRSAYGVGERYCYDEKHSLQVAALATQLFDGLANFLDLTFKDRILLEVGAILHDIGKFVSEEAHHKHSQYLISWAEIIGISRDDCELIGLIARYHRKAHPLSAHEEYARLNIADRLRVSKLAAILRVADALDHSHLQAIKKLETKIKDDTLRIFATSKTDLSSEQNIFKEKSNLLNLVTGLTMELRRK